VGNTKKNADKVPRIVSDLKYLDEYVRRVDNVIINQPEYRS
jgi:hypothetical protein